MDVQFADSEEAVRACFPVMQQLRTSLGEDEFVHRVAEYGERYGYRLVFIGGRDGVCAAAGYRVTENLSAGRFLYVDDLVTDEFYRGQGHGGRLMDWLIEEAIREQCDELHLDSGVQRFAAHRLYIKKGLDIVFHHFALKLT